MTFAITSTGVRRYMLLAMAALFLLHLAGRILRFGFGHDHAYGFVEMFNLNVENNIPTLYSGLTMLFASGLCLLIAEARRRRREKLTAYWFGLSLMLLLAALDETLALHESISQLLKAKLEKAKVDTTGIFYYAWTLPYALICMVAGFIYLNFFRQLPSALRNSMLLAAAVFLLGALGLEAWSGSVAASIGTMNFYYLSLGTVEEMMEMTGVMIFILGQLRYIEQEFGAFRIVLG